MTAATAPPTKAPTPDRVERGDGIEGVVGMRQFLDVSLPAIPLRAL
jgi:hypothetical protein